LKVDINTQNRLKTARIKMSKTCPSHETNKTWPMVRLGDVCDEIKDRIQSSKISVGEYVTTDNMVKDCGGIVPAGYVPSEVGLVEYHKGDVLIANIRPYLKKIWLADHDGGCSSDVVVFRSNIDGLSSEYLYSVLSQDAYFEYVMQKPRGTKMPRGDRDWMKEFRFPLPSLSVQREIVTRLERELAAVEKMKKGFETLAETAQAEFEAERLEAHKGLLDGDWPCEPLKKHVDVLAGYAFKSQGFVDSGIRICGGLIIAPDRIKWEECKYWNSSNGIEQYLLQENDLVIALDRPWISGGFKIGVIGKRDLPCLLIQRTARLRMKDVDFRYVMMLLRDESFKLHCTTSGTTVPHISHKDIETYEIPFPPAKVQKEIVARLSAAKTRAEKLEAKAREGVAVCETMRKAILKEAFE
jgi:restriction endonuclease S subunit